MRNIITKKINEIKYNKAKNKFFKNFLNTDIGRFVIEEDKIVCYVNQELLNKNINIFNTLELNGFYPYDEEINKKTKEYGFDKPIQYIFEGINFPAYVSISSMWASVIFENCTFENNVYFFNAHELTFENNKYYDWLNSYFYSRKTFLTINNAEKVKFINDEVVNSHELNKKGKFNLEIKLDTKELEIINSKIKCGIDSELNIEATKTKLVKSQISAAEIYLNSDSIESIDSYISADKGIIIENKEEDFNEIVMSPYTVYNRTEISKNTFVINNHNASISENRLKLLESLKEVKKMCFQINQKKLENEAFIKCLEK